MPPRGGGGGGARGRTSRSEQQNAETSTTTTPLLPAGALSAAAPSSSSSSPGPSQQQQQGAPKSGTTDAAIAPSASPSPSPSPPCGAPLPAPPQPPSPPPVRFTVTPRFLARVHQAAWTGLDKQDDDEEQQEDLLARLLPALLPARARRRRERELRQRQQQYEQQLWRWRTAQQRGHQHQQQQQQRVEGKGGGGGAEAPADEEEQGQGGALTAPPAAAGLLLLRLDPASAESVPDVGPAAYASSLLRLAIFYWALVSDALLVGALFANAASAADGGGGGGEGAAPPAPSPPPPALLAVAGTLALLPHAVTALLLVARQGWLSAACQAALFVLSLNPLRSLLAASRRPRGAAGALLLAAALCAYLLVAASGLLFVAYCVVCYLATALLFSLLVLDLAALVVAATPTKKCFKYSDLVYGAAYRTTRLAVHAALQSLPALFTVVAFCAYADFGGLIGLQGKALVPARVWGWLWGCGWGDGEDDAPPPPPPGLLGGGGRGALLPDSGRHHHPGACAAPPLPSLPFVAAVGVPPAVLAQAAAAHLLNLLDKLLMLRASADAAGCAPGWWRGALLEHGRSVLAVRAASWAARPVVADNVERAPRERPDAPPLVVVVEEGEQERREEQEEAAAAGSGAEAAAATAVEDDDDGEDEEEGDDDEDDASLDASDAAEDDLESGRRNTTTTPASPQTQTLTAAQQRRRRSARRERARLNRRLRRLPGPSALLLTAGDEVDAAERRAAEREASANDEAASVVPEWLSPADGARLCAGQLTAVATAAFSRYAGPGVRDLALDLTRASRPGRLLTMAVVSFPQLSTVRLARACVWGEQDSRAFAAALLALPSLAVLQMHGCELDVSGVEFGLERVLSRAKRLQSFELCGGVLPQRGAVGEALARGLRRASGRLRDLSLAGTRLHPDALEAVVGAVADSESLAAVNLAYCCGGWRRMLGGRSAGAGEVLARLVVGGGGGGGEAATAHRPLIGQQQPPPQRPLMLLALGLDELGERGGQEIVRAVLDATRATAAAARPPRRHPRPSIAFRWSLGVAPVKGLSGDDDGDDDNNDPLRVVVVGNRESVTFGEAWSALVADAASERGDGGGEGSGAPRPSCPIVALVLTQDEAVRWRPRLPRLFLPTHGGMDELDLSSLGLGDGGAVAAAREVSRAMGGGEGDSGPPVRSLVLADNGIGAEGVRALAEAIEGLGQPREGGGGEEEEEAGGREQQWWPWWPWWRRRLPRRAIAAAADADASSPRAPLLPPPGGDEDGDVEAPPPPTPWPPRARFERLDLSCNDLDDDAALALASAIAGLGRGGAGAWGAAAAAAASPPPSPPPASSPPHVALTTEGGDEQRQQQQQPQQPRPSTPTPTARRLSIVLAGNKLPFAPETLRALVAAARSNRARVRLQLDETPEQAVARLEASGDAEGAERARLFFAQQAARRVAARRRREKRRLLAAQSAAAAVGASTSAPSGGGPASFPLADEEEGGGERVAALLPSSPPSAPPPPAAVAAATGGAPSSSSDGGDGTCGICFDASLADGDGVALRYCGHRLCVGCYRRVWEVTVVAPPANDRATPPAPLCPFCRSRIFGYYYLGDDDEDDFEEEVEGGSAGDGGG